MAAKRYYIDDGGRRVPVPSVTTILGFVGDKGGLQNWYFQQGKEAGRLEIEEGHEPFRTVWDLPKSAATIGTVAHAMIEADIRGVAFDRTLYDADVIMAADRAFQGWTRWRDQNRIEPVATEWSCASSTLRYGGTIDFVYRSPHGLGVMDFKTGGVYPDHILQVVAYACLWHDAHRSDTIAEVSIMGLSKADGSLHHHSWQYDSDTVRQAAAAFASAHAFYTSYQIVKKAI